MSLQNLKTRTRLAMGDLLDRTLGMLQPLDPSSPSRALDLSELEERILLSASPVMAVGEMVEAAPADSMSVESAMASVADSSGSLSAGESSQQTERTGSTITTDPTATATRELVFLDTSVEDYQTLLNDLWANDDPSRDLEVVLLSNSRDGIDQISETLAGRTDIDSVHFVTHGTDRAVKLGSTWLTNDNLAGYAGEMARWGSALSPNADLLFYGCHLAGSESGLTLLESVQTLTGADIAASTDDTGAAVLGGDWDLEVELGAIESTIVFSEMAQADWHGLLNTFVVTTTADAGAGSLRQAITDANNLAGSDTIEFNLTGGGPYVIQVTSQLPTITDEVRIRGDQEDEYSGTPIIVIDGSLTTGDAGLVFETGSDDSVVRAVVINNFDDEGIFIDADITGVTIRDSYIGTDATGTLDQGNGGVGIEVRGSSASIEDNVISGNASHGIVITGTAATDIVVTGNYVGTNAAGTSAIANGGIGIYVKSGASSNTIGGTTASDRNIVSGNINDGVRLDGAGTSSNVVAGNYIGVDVNGTADLGNGDDGVQILGGATNNTIGGTTSAERNVISGNDDDGVEISGTGTNGNVVLGNYIGLDANGSSAIGNANDGVLVELGASQNTIGGTTTGSRNVISGDGQDGIRITGTGTSSNFVQGNYIGTNAAGTAAVGNTRDGVKIEAGATDNTVGGDSAAARNVISGNRHGVHLTGSGTDDNIVRGNYIGTDVSGTGNLGNLESGVYISQSAAGNAIGGTDDGEGNLIAFSSDIGVRLTTTAGAGNSILRNSIHSNTGLGIDLEPDGATSNDSGDADIGPNSLQNYPVLTSAFTDGSSRVAIAGTLNSTALTTFRLEFFSNSGGGDEGETYLGFRNVITNSSGDASFVESFAANVSVGINITATATNLATGDTSEFSVVQTSASALIVDTTTDTVDGTTTSVANLVANKGADGKISLREAIIATNNTAGHDGVFLSAETYTLSIAGKGEDFAATGELNLRESLSLIGAGAGSTIIDGADLDRIFQTYSGNDYFLQGLTIQNASLFSDGGALTAAGTVTIADSVFQDNEATNVAQGGAIRSNGTLNLDTVRFTNNTAADRAGALYSTGDTFIVNSLFENNSAAGDGGAIWHDGASPLLELINVTMSGNSANGEGGAIYASDDVNLVNVTITDNLAGGNGGGFALGPGGPTISVHNSIIAGNSATTSDPDFHGAVVSQGYNIIGDTTGSTGFGSTGDQLNVDPKLAPLADFGGPTLTHALYSGSPAEDAGDPAFTSLVIDQRSMSRSDGSSDIGAYEGVLASNILYVDTASDANDTGLGSSFTIDQLLASKGTDGKVSLREAIIATNNTANIDGSTPDEIRFAISTSDSGYVDPTPGSPLSGDEYWVLTPGSFLGNFTDEIILDATTQLGYDSGTGRPVIEIDGSSAAGATAIFVLRTNDSTIKGFALHSSADEGLEIDGQTGFGDNNTIQSNWIGLDAEGNVEGNTEHGIAIAFAAAGNVIGGSGVNEGNVIAGNSFSGVLIRDAGTDGTLIQGNLIGVLPDGTTPAGNGHHGIEISTDVDGTIIGGENSGEGNTIRNNTLNGISVNADSGTGNSILRNLISSNSQLGIDLGNNGVTSNDTDDGDSGANNLQNFPVLNSAVTDGSTEIDIAGSINTTASENVLIQFYANDSNDGTGHGEGQTYLGFTNVTTGADGNATFDVTLSAAVAEGAFISATATNSGGSTSEFALSLVAQLNNSSPVITSDGGGAAAGVNVPENTTTVTTVTSTDADGGTPAYSINGGADAARFSIGSSSGDLTFDAAPDFETPTDADTDNVYEVTVQVSDGAGGIDSQTISVTVTGVNESPTFLAGDGIVVTDVGTDNDTARSVVVQPDGKIVTGGYAEVGGVNLFALTRYDTDGTLDSTFGTSGVVTTSFGGITNFGYQLAIQDDGKLLLAGGSFDGAQSDYALARYNSDGSLDSSFGTGGQVLTDFPAGESDVAHGVAVQPDGKILVSGITSNGTDYDFALARYNSNGTLDTSFNGDGLIETPIGSGDDRSWTVSLQSDGRVLVGGYTDNGSDYDYALVRYDSSGNLDASFGTGGIVTTDLGGGSQDIIYDIAIQSDGKIVVAGQAGDANKDFSVTRYNSDGSLDTSFGTGGTTTNPVGTSHDFGQGLALQSDGKIVVAGRVFGVSNGFGVARLNTDGSLDASFGTGGTTIEPTGGSFDEAWDLALQNDDSIVVVGNIHNADLESDFGLVRFSSEGVADSRFDLVNSLDGTPTFTEDGPAVVLDADVTIFDDELSFADDFNGATLTLQRNGGADADDVFSSTGTLDPVTEGGNLVVSSTTIGTVTTHSTGTLLLAFNSSATNDLVNEAMRQIAYSNPNDIPPVSVQIDWTFDDGSLQASGSTTVSITASNDDPVITSDNGGTTAAVDVAENSTAVTTVTSSDSDGGTPSYSISGGDDSSKFEINSSSGELTFKNAPDFENPSDVGTDNIYDVTVEVSDGAGGTDSQNLSVTVTNIDATPVNSVPGDQTVDEDGTLTFNAANGNLISLSAEGDEVLTLTLSVGDGILSLSQTTGLTFTNGDGTDDASLNVSGTLTNINAALDGLQYTPGADFNGSDSLTILSADTSTISLDSDPNLVGYYEFTSPSPGADSSPIGTNTATLQGDATIVTDVSGGDVLSLGGSGDYAQISGEFGQPTSLTLAAWVNGTQSYGEVFSIQNRVILRFDDINFSRGVNAIYHDGTTYRQTDSGQFLEDTGWHHLAMTFDDPSKTMTLYIDGVQAVQNTFTNSISYLGGDTFIGSNAGSTLFFNGLIDDARIFDRALTSSEISQIASTAINATDSDSVTINVNAINDRPVVTVSGTGLNYTENDSATVMDPAITVSDSDSGDFDGGELRVGFAGGTGRTGDVLAIRNQGTEAGQIGVSGSNVTYEGTTIGTFTGGTSSTPLVVMLNSNATPQKVQILARNITFENTSDNPSEATRTVRFDALDGDGGDATNVDTTVDVSAVNDAPTITSNGRGATAAIDIEDGTTAVTTITSSDPDGGTANYSISGGADAAKFDIDSASGVLTLKTAADFTTPADSGNDGVYELTVEVSDGAGGTDSQSIQTTIVAPDIRLIYGQGADATPQFREFDTIRDILSGESTTTEAGSTIRWSTSVLSPDGSEELVAIHSDTGSATELNLLRWDGSAWAVDWTATDIASANSDKQGFSIAYETSSGHAVAVYSNNTTNPVYRVWNGSDWTAEADVFATPPGSGTVLWVELASSPISDEITLVYSDSAELHTVVWDGNAWNEAATENTLEETLSSSGNSRAFDVAYESSGDVLIAWGDGSNVDFETRAAGTTTWVDGSEFPVVSGIITFVDLASDPVSDRIAFAGIDDNAGAARLGLMTWDGLAWQDVGEYDNGFPHVLTDGFSEFWAGVGWVGTTGEAIAVYSDSDAGVLNWASWNSDSGWTIEADVTVTGADLLRSVELQSYGNDGLVSVFSDQSGSLWGLTYEGGSWTVLNGGAALETTVADFKTKPFSFSVERFGGNDSSIVDLNGSDTDGTGFSTGFTEGGGRISVTDTDATISDIDHSTYLAVSVNLAGFADGTDEEIRINNEQFDFGVADVLTTTVGGTLFNLDFDGSGFAIDNDAGGVIPEADLQALIRLFEYENQSLNPTAGNRTFSFAATDEDGRASTASVSTISVSGVNNRPTLTSFAGAVDTTPEDIEVEITFAEIAAQGNEADADGAVTAFVVKSVPTGSLKIGMTADTAIAYSAAFNNVIDATNNAYWTPSLNSNGSRNAFTVVARDNLGEESIGNIAVPISVTPVNDDPTITPIADQTPNEDTATGDLAFTIGDVETAASSLVVSATSSDQDLVPDGNIMLGGAGTSRSINVLPGTNQNGGPATITVSVFDGEATTQATFDVTVAADNDAPVASISVGGYGVDEDDSQRILTGVSVSDVDAGGNDVSVTVSVDDGDLTVTTTTGLTFTDGANGSSTFTAKGTISEWNAALGTLRYQPDPEFNRTDTFTLFVDDLGNSGGGSLTSMDSVPITVTAVNDAPLLDLDANDDSGATGNNFSQTFEEGGGPVSLVDDDVALSDIDSDNLSSITVALANRLDPASKEEIFADASGTSLAASWDSGTNTLTIDGPGTVADYLTVLNTVAYNNTANNPDATTRTITFVANDGTDDSLLATTTLLFSAVNDAPVINSDGGADTAAVSVAENVAEVTTVTSTDVDGGTPVYSISGGADSTKFSIDDGTGILKFVSAPDFESPTDTTGNNDYEVIVQVSDQNGGFDTQAITVTVTAENDNNPVITSDGAGATFALDVAENSTAVTTVTATDADLPAQTLVYSISGGADSTKFNIDSGSGVLTFASAPDFDAPADANGDNDYEVTVKVSDGAGRTDSQNITVSVTDLNDTTPVVDDGQSFFVIESATDATSLGTVTATDPDTVGSLQNWTIVSGNASSAFAIDSASGELTVNNAAALDFETLPTFTLTVRVSDGTNTSADQTVTVNVTNANDAPVVSAPASDSVAVGETLTFAAANGNAISVSDVEESELRIQLSVDDGTLSLSGDTGLVFLVGTGTADATMTFEGSIASINAALEGLEYVHGDNHSGICTITIEATDFSATGPGGPITSTDMVAISVLMPAGPPISGDAFLQGNFLEVGFGQDGILGSQGNAPVGFNSAGAILGVEVDHDRDGFGTGQVDGDFILPGTPEEAFGISVGGTTTFNSNSTSQAIAGTLSNFLKTGSTQSVDFNGTVSGLQIDATHSVGINDQFMDVAVTLTNSTDATMSDVYYFRNVDPDNNFDTSGTFATTNTVISQGSDGSAQAYVTATQADGSLLGLLGFGENARVTRGGFSNRDPIAIWNGTGGLTQSGTSTADEAVSLAFKFESIGAGESLTFRYRYVFGETQAPVLDLDPDGSTGAAATNSNVSYTENDGAVLIADSDATIFDGDSTHLTGLSVQITNDLDGVDEFLSANTNGTSITAGDYNSSTGVLALKGTDTVANYRQVLRTLSYTNTSETPDTETREIQVIATDGTFTSNTARAFVSVSATNDVPVITSNGGAATASISIEENETDVTTVTSSDLDSDTLKYSITGGADASKFDIDSGSGVLTFVTAPDFENATDVGSNNQYEVTVSVIDGNGGSDSQDITVTVVAVNDNKPVIISNGGEATASITLAENSAAVTTVTATDDDLPAQDLDFTISGGADAARFIIDEATGELTFEVAPNFETPSDTGADNDYEVIVRVSDGIDFFDTQTITVTITDVDEFDVSAITDADNGTNSVNENASAGVSVGIRATATDDDATTNAITYSLDDDSNGEFFIEPSAGDVKVAGPIDYEAGATRTITVRVTSEDGSFSTKEFSIDVNDLNDNAPIISVGQTFEVSEFASNGDSVGTATATDPDIVGTIQNWAITGGNVDNIFEIDSASGELRVADNSLLNFETMATYTLSLRVEDGANTSSNQSVTVNVIDQNDLPVLNVNAGISVVEGGDITISKTELSVTDEDELPGEIQYSIVDAPTAGRLELTTDPGVSVSSFTQADIDNNLLRFVHDGSEADDSFTFSISDGSGGTIGTTLFSITNLRVNDAPVNSTPTSQTTSEDTPLVFSSGAGNGISVSDVDLSGGLIGIRLVATNGTLTLGSTSGLVFATGDGNSDADIVFAGLIADVNNALEGLTFAPTADYNGLAGVRVISRDMGSSGSGGEQIDDDTIEITVTAVNDNPVASDDEYSINEDITLTVSAANGLLSNDSDIDGDALSVVAVSSTANGALSLSADGSFVYTPNENFNGVDSFTYRATDGSLQSETRTVTLNVAAVNDASVSIDDEFTIDQLTVLELSAANGVLVNDLDVEADELQAVLVDGPQNGRLVLNADGSLTYKPNATFFGEDTFTYRSVDGSDDGSIATVRIVVRQTVTSGGDGDVVVVEESDTTATDVDEANDGGDGDNGTGIVAEDTVDGSVDTDSGEASTTLTMVSPVETSGEATDTTTNVNDNTDGDDGGSTAGSTAEQPTFITSFRIDERGELRDRVTGRIVEDAGVVVFTSTDVGSMVYVLEQTGFWTELDTFEQDVQASILQEGEWEELVVETTTVAGTTLTVGYIVWLLRSGSVVFGLVSSLPAWTMMDPLPVLESGLEGLGDSESSDDDSLQGILQAHHDGTDSPAESFEN